MREKNIKSGGVSERDTKRELKRQILKVGERERDIGQRHLVVMSSARE